MSLDFCTQFLEVLDDGMIDSTAEIRMLVSDNTGLIANSIVYILDAREKSWVL
jgi:hypothetical protein